MVAWPSPQSRPCQELIKAGDHVNGSSKLAVRISDERIGDFIRSYEAAFNEPLSRDDARIMVARLVELYRLFLRRPTDAPASNDPIAETLGTSGTCPRPDSSRRGEL
jgi:hypothetical protein